MTGITVKPNYPSKEVEYAHEIDEIVTKLVVDYDNDGGNVGDTTFMDDTYVPTWVEPPDLHFVLTFPKFKANLENSWVRNGSLFSKSGETIADVNEIKWEVFIHDPNSIKTCKIYNPFGYTLRCELWRCGSDKSETAQMFVAYVQPRKSNEWDIAQFIETLIDAGDEYLKVKVYIYDENITDNYVMVDSTNETFAIGFPDSDPKNKVPIGPSVWFDCYNVIDRYGLTIAGIAGISSAVATQVVALKENSSIATYAETLGISIATLAAILGLGLGYNWITFADMQEYILPGILTIGSAGMGAYLMNRASSKYTYYAGMAIAGVGNAGAALALLAMIDDIKIACEI